MSNLLITSGAFGFAIFMICLFTFPLFAFFIAVGYFLMKDFASKNTNSNHINFR